jgi:hypothetical protein
MGLVIFFLKYKTKPESQMKSKPTFIKKILNLKWCPSKQKAKQLQIEQGKKKDKSKGKAKNLSTEVDLFHIDENGIV